jgi:hypothetical protein
MHHAVTEAALVQQFKPETDIVGEGLRPACHDDGGRNR